MQCLSYQSFKKIREVLLLSVLKKVINNQLAYFVLKNQLK